MQGDPGLKHVQRNACHELEPVSQIRTLVQIGLARFKGKPEGLRLPPFIIANDKLMHFTNRIPGVGGWGSTLYPMPKSAKRYWAGEAYMVRCPNLTRVFIDAY